MHSYILKRFINNKLYKKILLFFFFKFMTTKHSTANVLKGKCSGCSSNEYKWIFSFYHLHTIVAVFFFLNSKKWKIQKYEKLYISSKEFYSINYAFYPAIRISQYLDIWFCPGSCVCVGVSDWPHRGATCPRSSWGIYNSCLVSGLSVTWTSEQENLSPFSSL